VCCTAIFSSLKFEFEKVKEDEKMRGNEKEGMMRKKEKEERKTE
jgi:hypothetical protein